jgi:hypothetical protein
MAGGLYWLRLCMPSKLLALLMESCALNSQHIRAKETCFRELQTGWKIAYDSLCGLYYDARLFFIFILRSSEASVEFRLVPFDHISGA